MRVLFFSVLRERLGTREMEVPIERETTVGDFVASLAGQIPVFADYASSARLAVNRVYADLDTPIRPGDEVAVITPVSGG